MVDYHPANLGLAETWGAKNDSGVRRDQGAVEHGNRVISSDGCECFVKKIVMSPCGLGFRKWKVQKGDANLHVHIPFIPYIYNPTDTSTCPHDYFSPPVTICLLQSMAFCLICHNHPKVRNYDSP